MKSVLEDVVYYISIHYVYRRVCTCYEEKYIAYLVDPFWKSSELSQNIHLMIRKYIMARMKILGVDLS